MPSVFISYRRLDTAGEASHLADDLVERFGRSSVFIDIDSISAGADFEARIGEALDTCQVALVLIGDRWLTVELPDGSRRIDDEADYVRKEIAAALERDDVTVVPVLVEGAEMPPAGELPSDISRLPKLNALELSNKRWRYDFGQILGIAEGHDTWWRRFVRWLPRWAKRGGPVLALAVVGAVAAVVATSGGGPDKATKVAACERAHGLSAAQVQRPPRPGESRVDRSQVGPPDQASLVFEQKTFASCDWPPPPGADSDGYRAITVTVTNGPVAQPESSGRTIADRIESNCKRLRLEYTYAHTGDQTHLRPFQASPGDIWGLSGDTSGYSRIAQTGTTSAYHVHLPFYPRRREVVVLRNGSTGGP